MNIKEENKTIMMLIRDAHHLFGHKIREGLSKQGISNTTQSVLIYLKWHDAATQVELVEMAHVRPSTISVTLQKMESDGLITRCPSETDQRCTIVKITEQGLKLCEENKKYVKSLDELFTKDIDKEELEITKKVLKKISEKMLED